MSSNKKLTREELAAALEEKAKALREDRISDEDVDKISSSCGCCGACTLIAPCPLNHLCDQKCDHSCTSSSPD